jgi:hypothetical protein
MAEQVLHLQLAVRLPSILAVVVVAAELELLAVLAVLVAAALGVLKDLLEFLVLQIPAAVVVDAEEPQ